MTATPLGASVWLTGGWQAGKRAAATAHVTPRLRRSLDRTAQIRSYSLLPLSLDSSRVGISGTRERATAGHGRGRSADIEREYTCARRSTTAVAHSLQVSPRIVHTWANIMEADDNSSVVSQRNNYRKRGHSSYNAFYRPTEIDETTGCKHY